MKFLIPCFVLLSLFNPPVTLTAQDADQSAPLYGNIFGTVKSVDHDRPIELVTVSLHIISDSLIPVRQTVTDADGKFLFSGVETELYGLLYTVKFIHSEFKTLTYEHVLVKPGATSSLGLTPKLSKHYEIRYSEADIFRPLYYYSESIPYRGQKKTETHLTTDSSKTAFTVFATREGLVGFTTANGHVIKERDKFVALPSRRGLNPNDQQQYYAVKLTYNGKTTTAPVWDIGPWNTRDDYWNPPSVRENWNDLPTGTPESQAAFLTGYNSGKDQFNRIVKNPAGIDLADGIFWDDLNLPDNSYIDVEYLWRLKLSTGDTVKALTDVNIRSEPAGTLIGATVVDQKGTIIDGYIGAVSGSSFYLWWKIKWSDSLTGWSAEPFLRKSGSSGTDNPSNNPVLSVYPNPFHLYTTIEFSLVESGFTKLLLYNLNGQLIKTLVNNFLSSGPHKLSFSGSELSSGVYFLYFDNSKKTSLNKITILK